MPLPSAPVMAQWTLHKVDATKMKQNWEISKPRAGYDGQTGLLTKTLKVAGLATVMMVSGIHAAGASPDDDVTPCATTESVGDNTLVAPRHDDLVITIRPSAPKVGRPVTAWISGYQPGRLLVARQVSWSFNNAASMLKDSGGGSASTIYLTPGNKKISVQVTDMSGKRKKATCSLDVTW